MYAAILVSLVLSLLFSPGISAQMTSLETPPGIEKIQPELLQQMTAPPFITRQRGDAQNMYRVIVNLHTSPHTDHLSAEGLTSMQQRVQAAQDAILQTRQRGMLTLLNRYQNIFSFSALANREAIFELAAMAHVEFIESVPIMQKMDEQSHALTGVDQVHAAGFTGRGVTIAMIDDGIDASHPAFGGDTAWPNDKIIGGYDFADDDSDPRNDCAQQSHGTAVAGIAAGNGGGVLGTAPDAHIVLLKIQSAQQCGGEVLDGDLIGALDWILTHREQFGIDIISMSLGGQVFSSASVCNNAILAIRQLIDLAHDAGLIIFAAAGNEAQSSAIAQPACMSNVISVGAVYDANLGPTHFATCNDAVTGPDRVTCYSNSSNFLDILAPAHCATTASTTHERETCFGGTSASTPFAAGVAATLLEAAKTPLTNDSMRHLLVSSGVADFDDKSGLFIPRLDAQAAHDALDTVLVGHQ
jgi:subtilisin family serine protease